MQFKLKSSFKPSGSQPEAIKKLVESIKKGNHYQILLGVTGSGKSLDYNEQIILINEENLIEKIKIGDFVERSLVNHKKLGDSGYNKILSFNPESFSIEEKEINEVSKHKEENVYEIILDDYSKIKVTKDHNCFRFKNCKFELVATEELKIGDSLPTSNIILTPRKEISYINLLEYNKNSKVYIGELIKKYDLTNSIILNLLKKYKKNPTWKLKQILNKTKELGISISQLYEYLDILGLKLEQVHESVKVITKKEDKSPSMIYLNEKFLVFSGLYVARGHSTGKYILISNKNNDLQKLCKSCYESLRLKYHQRNKNDIQYYSKILTNFFSIFGKTAYEKRIPSLFYNLDKNKLSIFIRSIFDGDGYVEDRNIALTSASEELVNDLKNLLLRYNITSTIRIKKVNRKMYYLLTISGRDNLLRYKEMISFSINDKKDKLLMIIREKDNTNVDLIPNSSNFFDQKQIAKMGNCERSYISMIENNKRNPSKKIFGKIIDSLCLNDICYLKLKNLLNYNFRRIISIKKIKSINGYVYDLSVKDNENFSAGYGNIFVHNTFSMASVIEKIQKPTLVIAHNKTLAAQLYEEFKEFFPENKVEYFVSYYDYYQPESYIPQKDQYIEKDASINPKIEQMRLSATASLMSRKDTIIVSSVSCIYSLGKPENFEKLGFQLNLNQKIERKEILKKLLDIQYERNDMELSPGRFRVKGDTIDFIPGYYKNIIRIEMLGNLIENIYDIDKITGKTVKKLKEYFIYPAKHFVIPETEFNEALESIKKELYETLPKLGLIESHRLKQRTLHDIEMIKETGYCKGIENYSRHFDKRISGEPPYTLFDYFPKGDFLIIIDESHQTIPQLHGMYAGDYSRKKNLVDYGFRLPSAFDNRPLKFTETENFLKTNKVIFVSATPGDYEKARSEIIVEQIIRPTGLVDPEVIIKPIKSQINDIIEEIRRTIKQGDRILVTTLTKKLAEELTDYLAEKQIKTRYLHSEINTIERTEIIRQLRLGKFDVLVGINLLREGLDIPEVGFIGILDADKEGFLRDSKSLIQIIGRAARNINSRVVLYADNITNSIKEAVNETKRRRDIQLEYNKKNNIIPKTIIKPVKELEVPVIIKDIKHIPKKDIPNLIINSTKEMQDAAEELDFEKAIELRERIKELEKRINK
jgi:excinuclease ABC subunit B